MEQLVLGVVSRHVGGMEVVGGGQHGFTEGKRAWSVAEGVGGGVG